MKNATLPQTPRQLRWMLASKLGATSIMIGLAAGGGSYLLETSRTEQAALDRATTSARHFESPAMEMAFDGKAQEEHGTLNRLLDRTLVLVAGQSC